MAHGRTKAGCYLRFKMINLPYRKNVAGILFDGKKILLVTKKDLGFWQFIQGGIDSNEGEDETLRREILEETGIKEFNIIKKLKGNHQWDWNPELQKSKGFKGQQQSFFLVKVKPSPRIQLQKNELEDFKWVSPLELKKETKYPPEIINEIFREIGI